MRSGSPTAKLVLEPVFEADFFDPLTFLAASALLVLVALATAFAPARRAVGSAPVRARRGD